MDNFQKMRYYPVLLDLKGKKCSVVGAGSVAERKTRTLIASGARVKVISKVLSAGLKRLLEKGKIRHCNSNYRSGLLKDSFLVIAATDNNKVNLRVSRDAQRSGILTNIVDLPKISNFIVPSVIRKDGLIIAISTGGRAPCLSKKIRIDLTRNFLPRYSKLFKLVENARKRLKIYCPKGLSKKDILTRLVNSQS
jgi:precorrin-2 dehydrogenase / sirohydrochlorin ferrochelatase